MSSTPITALIITRNEENFVPKCIASVRDLASEILVLDSGSTDRTVEIAREMGARVVETNWPGFADQKNKGAELAKHHWILSIDADEELSPELAQSIRTHMESGLTWALKMNRLSSWCGQWIRFSGWYPDTKIRVYPRTAKWQGQLHEELILPAGISVKKCRGNLLHYAVRSKKEHWAKVQKYAQLRAREWIDQGRTRLPVFWFLRPPVQFLRTYLVLLGFLDGKAGFEIALFNARAQHERYRQFRLLLKKS